MSNVSQVRVSSIRFLERFVWGTMRISSEIVDVKDALTTQRARCAILMLLVAWNELRQDLHQSEITEAELKRWNDAIGSANLDICDLFSTLKIADDTVLGLISQGRLLRTTYQGFKHLITSVGGKPGWIIPAIPIVKSVLSSSGDNAYVRSLHQAFRFGKKFCLAGGSIDFKRAAAERFIAVDQGIRVSRDIAPVKVFFDRYLSDLGIPKLTDFQHGSGRTAEYKRADTVGFAKDLFLGRDDLTDWGFRQLGLPLDLLPRKPFRRVSLLACVRKDSTKDRTIVFEPTTCQWLQQGYSRCIWRYIARHPYLSKRMNQERNGDRNNVLAKIGSIRGDFATIDLSNASDTVYYPFVLGITQDCPNYQAMIISSRCGTVDIDLNGDDDNPNWLRYDMRKMAGMGSAMTFPTECLVFSAIVEAAIELDGGDPLKSRYHVHGDDIVVETQYAETVLALLVKYGFEPNREKSFYTRNLTWNFRESCGGEYLDGEDITGVRLSRNFMGWPDRTCAKKYTGRAWQSQLMDLANVSFNALRDVRSLCIQKLMQNTYKGVKPAFSYDGFVGFKSDAPTNFHLKKRKNVALQRMEMAHGTWKVSNVAKNFPSTLRGDYLVTEQSWLADFLLGSWLTEWLRLAEIREESITRAIQSGCFTFYDPIVVEGLYSPRSDWGKTWSEDQVETWTSLYPREQ